METGSRVRHRFGGWWGTVVDTSTGGPDTVTVRVDGGAAAEALYGVADLVCPADDEPRYRIVRHYQRGGNRTIARGLTLAEARAHCSSAETSSSTATSYTARRRTANMGPWFDGYTDRGR